MKKNAKIMLSAAGIVLALAAGGYVATAVSYKDKFLPNTYLNEKNVGGTTAEQARAELENSADEETISLVKSDGSTEEITLGEIAFKTEYKDDIEAILEKQNSFLWIVNAFNTEEHEVGLKVSYDQSKLKEKVKELKCISSEAVQAPVDAHLEKGSNGYEIIDAIDGNKLDEKKVLSVVTDALEKGSSSVDLAENDCYLKAEVRADDPDLIKSLATMSKLADLNITIDLTGAQEKLDGEMLSSWITMDGDKIKADKEEIENYVTGLSVQYNTYMTERSFTATGGQTIQVGGTPAVIGGESVSDTYGFQLDIDETVKELIKAVESGKSKTVEAKWNIPALARDEENGDIGKTYIEIDLSRQHLWYYENGTLVIDYDVVTGQPNQPGGADEGRETPTGVFRVWSKETDKPLSGQNLVGHTWTDVMVDYWLAITWTGVGIHDADWQAKFGGSTYLTSGSQGCVNSPYDEVEELFNRVAYDTPVVIYKS